MKSLHAMQQFNVQKSTNMLSHLATQCLECQISRRTNLSTRVDLLTAVCLKRYVSTSFSSFIFIRYVVRSAILTILNERSNGVPFAAPH